MSQTTATAAANKPIRLGASPRMEPRKGNGVSTAERSWLEATREKSWR